MQCFVNLNYQTQVQINNLYHMRRKDKMFVQMHLLSSCPVCTKHTNVFLFLLQHSLIKSLFAYTKTSRFKFKDKRVNTQNSNGQWHNLLA